MFIVKLVKLDKLKSLLRKLKDDLTVSVDS